MKTIISILILFSCILFTTICKCQSIHQILENQLESYNNMERKNANLDVLIDDLQQILDNPISINSASEDDLEKLGFLSQYQIYSILKYRKAYENIYSEYELYHIKGIDSITAKTLSHFLSFEKEPIDRPLYNQSDMFITLKQNFPISDDFHSENDTIPPNYNGSPQYYNLRIKGTFSPSFTYGFIGDKDPGEPFFTKYNKSGFDHYAGFIQVESTKILQRLIVGDYHMRIGQGIAFWTGYSTQKSQEVTDIMKRVSGNKGFSSAEENNYLRGASIDLKINDLSIETIGSYKKRDATIQYPTNSDEGVVTSISSSGYHRTDNEAQRKNKLNEAMVGAHINYHFSWGHIGIYSCYQKFKHPIEKNEQVKNKCSFYGDRNYIYGLYYKAHLDRFYLFGEIAQSKSQGISAIQGLLFFPSERVQLGLVYRNYSPKFHTLYGSGFGENGNSQNEKGFYLSSSVLPIKKIKLSFYADIFKFPWYTYKANGPSKGNEIFFQIDYGSSFSFIQSYFQFKQEIKEEKGNHSIVMYYNEDRKLQQLRYHTLFQWNEIISTGFRIEASHYKKEEMDQWGYLVFGELRFNPWNDDLLLHTRICFFDTPSYNSRIYTYENDLLYQYSIPFYYEKGIRSYLNFRYKVKENLSIHSKTGIIWKKNAGSENIRTNNDILYDFKLAVRVKV